MLLVGAAFLVAGSLVRGQETEGQALDQESGLACGAMSLATLLRLEGVPGTIDKVEARLADRPRHSMAEIRDAAVDLGLNLRGVRITEADWPLDRPVLAHLNRGGIGHYVVLRPVGHSGTMVQVIDAIHDVKVEDAHNLFASREWTGAVLIPARFGDELDGRVALCGTISLIAIGVTLTIRRILAADGGAARIHETAPATLL